MRKLSSPKGCEEPRDLKGEKLQFLALRKRVHIKNWAEACDDEPGRSSDRGGVSQPGRGHSHFLGFLSHLTLDFILKVFGFLAEVNLLLPSHVSPNISFRDNQEADRDGDGQINYEEFCSMMNRFLQYWLRPFGKLSFVDNYFHLFANLVRGPTARATVLGPNRAIMCKICCHQWCPSSLMGSP